MRVELLGGFAIKANGTALTGPWRLRKAKTLVKLLALAPGHRLHRDVLIDHLWPDHDGAAGLNNFHQALHAARRVLGGSHLVIRDEIGELGPGGDLTVDVDEFVEAATAAVSAGRPEDLRAALQLWTGELLPEDLYEDWAAGHRDRLNALRTRVLLQLAGALIERERAEEALALLEPVAAQQPHDEPIHRALIQALTVAGRRLEAIAAYERLRDGLDEEYGLPPDQETTGAYRQLFGTGAPAGTAVPHNLPSFSTTFIGRRRELSDLSRLLDRTRLLTLSGPGGAGKTRLAYELARRQLSTERYRDGVWVVELAGVTHGDSVPSTVATALTISLMSGRSWVTSLVHQLANRRLLLLLDNCEHVLDVVVTMVAELLAGCAELTVVATSREPLGLPGEVGWRVPSLQLPPDNAELSLDLVSHLEAVELFVERAHDVSQTFTLDADSVPAVVEICRRLDGIPLALELAAARLAHLSLSELADRLDDALTILAGRRYGRLDRQQTLAATLDWSHNLLLDDERDVFRRLAVFAGGFDLDGAASVGDVHDLVTPLGRLVDKSLVIADTTRPVTRYRLHEVVRQYAEARLIEAGEQPACSARHRLWYADQARRHDPDRGDPIVREPSGWFDTEQDNLRAALFSALEEDPCLALQLATCTWRFLLSRGQIVEGLDWLTRALAACPDRGPLRARALFAAGVLYIRRGEIEPLVDLGSQIVDQVPGAGDTAAVAEAVCQEAIFNLMGHEWQRAARLSAESLSRAGADAAVRVVANHLEGLLALGLGNVDRARERFATAGLALAGVPRSAPPFFSALTLAWVADSRTTVPIPIGEDSMLLGRRVGAVQAEGYLDLASALADRLAGQLEQAVALIDTAAQRFAAIEDHYGLAYAMSQRGHALRWLGDMEAALNCFDRAESLRRGLRDDRAIAMTMSGRSLVSANLGHAEVARRLAGETVAMMERNGDVPGVAMCLYNAGLVEIALGNREAALPLLAGSIALADRVSPQHILGWKFLLFAHVKHTLGDGEGSAGAAREALLRFEAIGDEGGRHAVQRACKERLITMPPETIFRRAP